VWGNKKDNQGRRVCRRSSCANLPAKGIQQVSDSTADHEGADTHLSRVETVVGNIHQYKAATLAVIRSLPDRAC